MLEGKWKNNVEFKIVLEDWDPETIAGLLSCSRLTTGQSLGSPQRNPISEHSKSCSDSDHHDSNERIQASFLRTMVWREERSR